MKCVIILPEGLSGALPKTSSWDLDLSIINSLVGYDATQVNAVIFHDSHYHNTQKLLNLIDHEYKEFNELDAILEEHKPDFVGIFRLEDLDKVIDKKISNLYVFLSEIPAQVPERYLQYLNYPWVKVISYLRSGVVSNRIPVDKYCDPWIYFFEGFNEIKKIKHENFNIVIPIDGSVQDFYKEVPISDAVNKVREAYPSSKIFLAYLGANLYPIKADNGIFIVSCKSLGEYYGCLLESDLQVILHYPDRLNQYPYYAARVGIRSVFYSTTTIDIDQYYPYLDKRFVEILGNNSVDVQSALILNDNADLQLRTDASNYDEVKFNYELHSVIRVLDKDFRPEYRESIESKLEKMDAFYKDHPEFNKAKVIENEGTDNKVSNGSENSNG